MTDPSMDEFLRTIQNRYNGGFNPYAAGAKTYGATARSAPNIGPVANRTGYAERDLLGRTKRNMLLKRMQSAQQGNYMSPAWLNNPQPGNFRM